jgi:hypothetical protein
MRLTLEEEPVSRHSFKLKSHLFSNAAAGRIVKHGDNFDSRKLELTKRKFRKQHCHSGANTLPSAARPDPIAKIRKIVNTVDLIDARTTKRFIRLGVEDSKLSIGLHLPVLFAPSDPFFSFPNRVVRMALRHPSADRINRPADGGIERANVVSCKWPNKNAGVSERGAHAMQWLTVIQQTELPADC